MQLGDAVVGVRFGEPIKYLGPLALVVVTAWGARTLWSARFEDDAVEFRFGKAASGKK